MLGLWQARETLKWLYRGQVVRVVEQTMQRNHWNFEDGLQKQAIKGLNSATPGVPEVEDSMRRETNPTSVRETRQFPKWHKPFD